MAILIATEAHRDQVSKDGTPYITHPLRVMLAGQTVQEQIVGVLHDVVEDTSVTLDDLRGKGFSTEIVAAVDAMTKRDAEDYMQFVARCKSNPIAHRVKLADLADNMNLDRIPDLTTKDLDRLNRYRRARTYLMAD